MLKLPGSLCVIKGRRVTGELKLLHHLLRAALLALEQKRHVDLELNDLSGLILVAARRLLKERLKPIARFSVIFLFEWNVGEIELRLPELRVDLGCFLKRCFRFIELLLRHENLAAQIQDRRLVRV